MANSHSKQHRTGIFWFSNDLRLADNRALQTAAEQCHELLLVYVIDSCWLQANRFGCVSLGQHRWRFLCESLQALQQELNELSASAQPLVIRFGDPLTEITQLMTLVDAQAVYASVHAGYHEKQHWQALQTRFPAKHFQAVHTHTLFTPDNLPFAVANLPGSFSKFRRLVEKKSTVLTENITSIEIETLLYKKPGVELPAAPRSKAFNSIDSLAVDDVVTRYPNAANMPLDTSNTVDAIDEQSLWQGGCRAAMQHCQAYFASDAPSTYKQTRNGLDIQVDGWAYSSKLSAWLANGSLSPWQVMAFVRDYEARNGANDSTYWLIFELLWREYFQWYAHHHGAALFQFHGINNYQPLTSFYAERWQKWCSSHTPYPIVNAAMRQLNATGYMSNRARQLVASCLVHELNIDWRYGAYYFEQQLVDYDVASNWGNWQYLAGVGADPRGHRRFDLAKQTRQYDPEGKFIQRWCGDESFAGAPLDSVDAADWPISR